MQLRVPRTWNPVKALYRMYFVGSPKAVLQQLAKADQKLADAQKLGLRPTGGVWRIGHTSSA